MALKMLQRGLKIDSKNKDILNMMKELGIRRKPVFPFLKREHPVNKFTGKVRSLFFRLVKGER
jgi:hypothetical protein